MPDIRYRFTASGADSVENAFRSIGASARSSAAGVDRMTKSLVRATAMAGVAGSALANAGAKMANAPSAVGGGGRGAGPYRSRPGGTSDEEKALKDAQRARERAVRDEQRLYDRRLAMARREGAKLGATAGREEAKALARTREASWGGAARSLGRDAIRGAGSAIKGIGMSALGGGAAIATGVTVAAARDAMRLQEAANRVSINSRQAGQTFIDPTMLRREFEATAAMTPGIKSADIAGAVQAFVTKTGNVDIARQSASTFATVASATGTDVEDVAKAAADLFQKFDITSIDDMRDALAALTYQGKSGAFELKDAAEKFAKMSSAAARFGVDKGARGVKTLGGLSQIAMSATGDADVAATAVEATLRQLITRAPQLKKMGVDVFDKNNETRDLTAILPDLIANVGGSDMAKKTVQLQKLMGDEGIRAISPLITAFGDAARGTKGTAEQKMAAGRAAVVGQLDTAINAPGDWSDVQRDAAQAQQDASAQLTKAWEQVVVQVGDKIVPALTELAKGLAESPELFQALGDAIRVLISMLESLGIIKRKEQTPEAAITQASKDRAKAEAELAKLPTLDKATPEQRQQIVDANARLLGARRIEEQQTRLATRVGSVLNAEQFADTYLNLGKAESDPAAEKLRRQKAMEIATQMAFNPASDYFTGERLLPGETNDQRTARVRQGAAQREGRVAAGGSAEGNGVALATTGGLDALLKAAQSAAAELSKISTANQASIVHG